MMMNSNRNISFHDNVEFKTQLSDNLNLKLNFINELIKKGHNIDIFHEADREELKKDYEEFSIYHKQYMYNLVDILIDNHLYSKRKGTKTPKFNKETPIKTFNIEYLVRNLKTGEETLHTPSIDLSRTIKNPFLQPGTPDMTTDDLTLYKLMYNISDSDFTLHHIPEIKDHGLSIKLKKSYVKVNPTYTNKFMNSKTADKKRYLQSMEFRVKSNKSLAEKVFDTIYNLYSFAAPHDYQQWPEIRIESEHKDLEAAQKGYDRESKIENNPGAISDINAIRMILPNAPDESYLHTVTNKLIRQFKLKPKKDVKHYLKSQKTEKNNEYESIHLQLPSAEIQVRTEKMHKTNEYGAASHIQMKDLFKRRRFHFMLLHPESKEVYNLFKDTFQQPIDIYR